MPEDNGKTPDETIDPAHAPLDPTPQAGGTPQAGPDLAKQETFDAAYVKKLRDEAAANRTKLREVEAELKKRTDAEMTETERQKAALDAAHAERDELKSTARRLEAQVAAALAGAPHPDVVARLVPPDAENITEAMQDIKKQYPALFARPVAGSADGGQSGKRPAAPSMNDFIRQSAGRS